MSFSLDDVRDSFTSDITRFLTEIEKGSKAIASATALAPAERTWQPPISAMVVGLHGIVGSSSLVGVDTLASTARRLEGVALLANESVQMLRAHVARLKKIASTCFEGSSDLRVILEHELAGRKAEAGIRKAVLDKKLDQAVKDIAEVLDHAPDETSPKMPPLPAGKIPAKIAVPTVLATKGPSDDGWEETPQGIDAELLEVFQQEAREALTNLRGYLSRLEQNAADREAATHCARLFHLLKGAAASVGLDQIAHKAKDLHAEVERLRATQFDPVSLKKLRERVEDFIAFSVPDLGAPAQAEAAAQAAADPVGTQQAAAAKAAADDEPVAIFREEAHASVEEARAILQQIRQTAGTARGVLTTRLERILHRLKGSALIVGEAQSAAIASRGQALCEALDRVDPDALSSVLEQISSMVKGNAPKSAAKGPSFVRINLPPQGEWDVFIEESTGLQEELDATLVKLESSQRPTVELSNLFRTYHTLKGAANAVGLTPLGQHLHIIETFLERMVASPSVSDVRAIVRTLAEQNETIKRNISRAGSEGEIAVDHERVHSKLAALGVDRPSQGGQGSKVTGASWIEPNDSAWSPTAVEKGSSRGESSRHSDGASEVPEAANAEPAAVVESDRRFIRVAADRLDSLLDLAGELVVCRSRMLSRVGKIQRLQEDDISRHSAVTTLIDSFAASTQFTNLDGRRRVAASVPSASGFGVLELDHYEEIHVLSRRLDEAASDIDEVRRDMGQEMSMLTEDAEMLSTIATGLQSEITRARMLMVDTLFSRLRPPIRDAAHRVGREVEIVTAGETLAIDKSMSDALYGPLLHMVRNAVYHGIESPEKRAAAGKPAVGRITLSAKQEHGEIVLQVGDDGAGVDIEKLRKIGIEKKLLPPDVGLDDPRVVELIFARGISTAEGADDVAGRGVGGNVVKRAIDRLNGNIQIQTTRGVGTTFTITMPLSMSITQAVLTRVGGILLAIPIAYAETIVSRSTVEMVDSFGRLRARMGDRMIPVHQMHKIFDPSMFKTAPSGDVLIVCVVGGERVVIEVDDIVSQEEIVVKSLGMLLEGHPLFSGSTSRGDGELALIIDVPGVLETESIGARGASRPTRTMARGTQPAIDVPIVEDDDSHRSEATPQTSQHTPEAPDVLDEQKPVPRPVQPKVEISDIVKLPLGRLRVLFVDDSLSVRKVAERMLTGLDVDVVTAVDGQDALEKLRAMQFSLVFTDLEMPRMHGYDLVREMQMLPAYKAIPVVVISSRSGQKHIDQAISLGAKEYLTKPFSPEILKAVLVRLARKG